MKAKTGKINGDGKGKHAYYVDLNGEDTQRKIKEYIEDGAPPSDKRGHSDRVQAKVHPVQVILLESLRSKAPKGWWASQSEQVRSLLALGCFVANKVLEEAHRVPEIQKDYKLGELLSMAKRKRCVSDLVDECRDAIRENNLNPLSKDDLIVNLEKYLKES